MPPPKVHTTIEVWKVWDRKKISTRKLQRTTVWVLDFKRCFKMSNLYKKRYKPAK
jgi:hypothetical protein